MPSCNDAITFVVGMAGWTGLVGYGLYNIRKRKMPLSVYLIHLRVKAQVFAVGCMTLAVVYNIYSVTMKRRQESLTNSTSVISKTDKTSQ